MGHLKRYSMPKYWPLAVKEKVWAVKPMAGPHPKHLCIPLQILVRDVLKYAESAREVKTILNSGKILVDKKVRKESGYPVGMMDVIEIPELKKYFRISVNKKGLVLEKISEEEANKKLCIIKGRRKVKGGRIQINLHDSRNIILGKEDKSDVHYKIGDTILISLPDQKILKHYKLEKGSHGMIMDGKNTGVKGVIKEVKTRKSMTEKSTVVIKSDAGEIETLKSYVMPGEF